MFQHSGLLEVKTVGDREIHMRREFQAPRALVFEAMTNPELLKRWLFGPPGWEMSLCEVDLRAGGKFRYEWRHSDGQFMAMGGLFVEVAPPERIVQIEKFDVAWYPGEMTATMELHEVEGRTVLTMRLVYDLPEGRAAALKTPMADGMSMGYDRLEAMLKEIR
jgi:uncharacterized protein YndB with AHSA1/START domain